MTAPLVAQSAAAERSGTVKVKKKLDSRILTLLKNNVQQNFRSFFVIVGDNGRDQVINLHFLLSKMQVTRPSVLWCYKNELGFTTHRKKRMKQIKKQIQKGIKDPDEEDPFELFVSSTNIRYAYYKETQKILGQTFGMCVLQDFEALSPNLLARTIETVSGGGIVVMLLKSMHSLKQLYTMTMDVHSRYRTESHSDVVPRFNERFILSLGDCASCLTVDDELNILPLSLGHKIEPLPSSEKPEQNAQVAALKEYLNAALEDSKEGVSPELLKLVKTVDQGKAVQVFIDALRKKEQKFTVSLTASRGRGKSAALGLALAAAVELGYANIFITSPYPENLKTVFEFVFKGLVALGYEEHLDYEAIQSTEPALNKAIVRLNVFKKHRQTIQYIPPQDSHHLAQAELVAIDEAAAIPLPLVKSLLGNYVVFMASTIHGYEGTGRALSLKLLQKLRETPSLLREVSLETPIRYALGDALESWMNNLLCLDCGPQVQKYSALTFGAPVPDQCELYHVERDALFSYHPVSESFLHKMLNLYVSSHYKNTPNDLQLMSDAPAHHLFVLLPPLPNVQPENASKKPSLIPEPLVVIQVCLEGSISKQSVLNALSRGRRADGDLIPWCMATQFDDADFAGLSGARIVRIATHPEYQGMGYGQKALSLLLQYYSGSLSMATVDETEVDRPTTPLKASASSSESLLKERLEVRKELPPLLTNVSEMPLAQKLDWVGVSFGLTVQLNKFWRKFDFAPVYLRQSASELTGEHTCIVLHALDTREAIAQKDWLSSFTLDFGRRFLRLLGYQFRTFHPLLVLSLLESVSKAAKQENSIIIAQKTASFTPWDLKRLAKYANNGLDYHVIMDLIPPLSWLNFSSYSSPVTLSPIQSAVLLAVGLQYKTLEELEQDLNLPVSQLMALLIKIVKKWSDYMDGMSLSSGTKRKSKDLLDGESEPAEKRSVDEMEPLTVSLNDDVSDAAKAVSSDLLEKQRAMVDSLNLEQYAIGGADSDWAGVSLKSLGTTSKLVSVPNKNSSKSKNSTNLAAQLSASHKSGKIKKKSKSKR